MNQLTNKSAHKKNKETDNIISHFILIGIFLINTLTDILTLIISAIQENSKPSVIDAKELEIKNEKRDIEKFGKAGSKSGAVLGDILGKVFSSKKTKKKK